jgi:PAS domain S-box-containing protein
MDMESGNTPRKGIDQNSGISEKTFQTVFENAFFGMVLVGTDGFFKKANVAACNLFGYSEDELLSLTFKDITYGDDLDAGVNLFQELMSGDRKFAKMEKRYIKKDGQIIWTLISTSVVENTSGAPQYLVTLFQDITDRKQAEEDLAEKELQYRSIFEDAFDGIVINDQAGIIKEVNPAFCKMHGYSRKELIGKTPKKIIRENDYSIFEEYLASVGLGKLFRGRAVDIRKDKTELNVEVHGSPIIYKGTPHVLGIVRDITSQIESEEMLEELVASRTRELSALVNVTNVSSSSLNLKEVLERSLDSVLGAMKCEMGAIHILDETEQKVILSSWRNVPEEILEEIEELPISSSLPGRVLKMRNTMVVPDMLRDPDTVPAAKRLLGERVYVGTPMKSKGKIIGVLVLIGEPNRDFKDEEISLLSSFSQQISIAVENARLHEQAEILAITEERQRIAREIHDIMAQGFTGINIQLDAVDSALELGNEPLALERLRRARKLSEQSLAEARRSVWALRSKSLDDKNFCDALRDSIRGLASGSGLKLSIDVRGDLPAIPFELQTDLLRVAQEAVMNVIKHAEATRLEVLLECSKKKIFLKITDDGNGFIIPNESAIQHDWSGFGITAMRERIGRHGGQMIIDSAPNRGTSVAISIDLGNREA